jgi:hypothetical protein
MLHINAATLKELREFLQKRINPKLKGVKSIKQLAKLYIEFAHNNRNSWGALFEYIPPAELELPEWYNKEVNDLFGIVESILSNFIPKKSDISKHAKIIWASIHGICILGLTQKLNITGSESMETLADCMIEHYLQSLEK